jgi:hypothetical protein
MMIHSFIRALLLLALCTSIQGFAGLHDVVSSASPFLHAPTTAVLASAATTATSSASLLLSQYTQSLAVNPLETKMATGAILATLGDAIAQSQSGQAYNVRRASSFAAFDVAYRAAQHALFPLIVTHCQGQFLTSVLGAIAPQLLSSADTTTVYAAAMEQTLASQLGIVPFLYYPVFFTLTGVVQGLSGEQSWTRAKDNFLPLLKRNLLYWIPVQFVQFAFVETSLQIPFLCVCGLLWTFLLSIMAGSTKGYNNDDKTEEAAAALVEQVEGDSPLPLVMTMDDSESVLANVDTRQLLSLENNVMKFDKDMLQEEQQDALLAKERI